MAKSKQHLGTYIDPRSDFGFKLYFGKANKILLIEFLNSLFQGEKVIDDLWYQPVEHDGDQEDARRVVFDLHCKGDDGEIFIIEIQHLFQYFFKDRAVFYTSRAINKQIPKGKQGNDYRLPEVYFIGILEFDFEDTSERSNATERPYFYDVALCDKNTKEVFYDKLGYKIITLPAFNKKPEELETVMDQWLYVLKHLSTMDKLPSYLDERIFGRIFEIGKVAKLKEEDLMLYEASLKRKRDTASVISSAERLGMEKGIKTGIEKGIKTGIEKGRREEAIAIATELKQMGISIEKIAQATGLSIEEIEKL